MLAGMAVAAAACLVLAVAPSVVAPALRRAVAALPAARTVQFTDLGAVVRLPGLQGSIAPGVIAGGVGVAALTAAALARWRRGRRPAPATLPLMGMWRRRSHRPHAVHGHLVRRAAATGLR